MKACGARILPIFNRCVVFSTTSTSFHGHPEPLACPEGETRKSIALYYYSKERPAEERAGEHNTLFQARPGEELAEPPHPEPERRLARERLKAALLRIAPPILVDAWSRLRARRR
jgi:hypothetical protein